MKNKDWGEVMEIENALDVFEKVVHWEAVDRVELRDACTVATSAIFSSKLFDKVAAQEISKLTGKDIDTVFEELKHKAYEEFKKMKNEWKAGAWYG